ncbi:hypothetical protein Apa02nite_032460 [Actinoplanes palleronii]|uniref:Mycothiol-dependent maleylpyruvate isomerase metal-binding domain-containing protein n=2 Tax=Actinoplanes palleronii TaxID=113570 RepID=A0ABQ4B8Y8_9ACTN|nr:hypothetical protein Apa02nite_032460 [Actinoplanes palleronii]
MPDAMRPIGPDDLARAVRALGETLEPLLDRDWSVPAGTLDWSCRQTLAHIGHDLLAYALQVAGQAQHAYLPADLTIRDEATMAEVLTIVEGCGALLVATLRAAGPDVRAWHFGPSDTSGFAALGVAEIILHLYDISRGLLAPWWPPAKFSSRVLARLAPDATAEQQLATGRRQHSTQVLLRYTGRVGDPVPWRWQVPPVPPLVAAPRCTCPCCGHVTLMARGAFEICDECWWEDDGQDDHNSADVHGGPNGSLSLDEARRQYVAKGRGRALRPR